MKNILSPAQAKAVYDAMCALNNVGGSGCNLRLEGAIVSIDPHGVVWIYGPPAVDDERYPTQAAFAAAYNLN